MGRPPAHPAGDMGRYGETYGEIWGACRVVAHNAERDAREPTPVLLPRRRRRRRLPSSRSPASAAGACRRVCGPAQQAAERAQPRGLGGGVRELIEPRCGLPLLPPLPLLLSPLLPLPLPLLLLVPAAAALCPPERRRVASRTSPRRRRLLSQLLFQLLSSARHVGLRRERQQQGGRLAPRRRSRLARRLPRRRLAAAAALGAALAGKVPVGEHGWLLLRWLLLRQAAAHVTKRGEGEPGGRRRRRR